MSEPGPTAGMRHAAAIIALTTALLAPTLGNRPVNGKAPAILRVAPAFSAMVPRLTTPGATVTISGSDLLPKGYRVEMEFVRRYLQSGEASTFRVPVTGNASSVTFAAPANIRGDSVVLKFTQLTDAAAPLPQTAIRIPGTLAVVQPPELLPPAQTITVNGQARARLTTGSFQIRGRHLLRPVVSDGRSNFGATLTTAAFSTTAIAIASATYDANATLPDGSKGVDVLVLTVPDLGFSGRTAALAINTHGGTASHAGAVYVEAPGVSQLSEFISPGNLRPVSSGQPIFRGREYAVSGNSLNLVVDGVTLDNGRVRIAGVDQPIVNSTSGQLRFTVQTSVSNTAHQVTASTNLGSVQVGAYPIADPPLTLPLADAVVVPSDAAGGTDLTATVSFAGTVPAGGSGGDLVVTTSDFNVFEGPSTRVIPITTNPMTVTIRTGGRTNDITSNIRFRVSSLTDSLVRPVTLRKLVPTAVTFPASNSVIGGQSLTARVDFNVPVNYPGVLDGGTFSFSCSIFTNRQIDGTWSSSDTTVARISPSFCIDENRETRSITTSVVPTTRTVTISARVGSVTSSATLTVLPGQLNSVTIDRQSLVSMQAATGTLTMSAPLPGAAVLLASSDPAVSVPAKLTLGSGLTTNFQITTSPVATSRSVTITAVVNGITQTSTITLQPLQITSVTMNPASVTAGGNTVGTIRLNATINLPITVTLVSSDPAAATIPATVSFAANQDAAIFSVQTVSPQSQVKTVTITATHSIVTPNAGTVSMSQTGTLTIQP